MRQVKLTEEEMRELNKLYRDTNQADIRTRCHIILLSNKGLSPPCIGNLLGLSRQTIRNWIGRYEKEGISGLYNRKRSGRPPKVAKEYLKRMEEAVMVSPRLLGLLFSNWTTSNLTYYLKQETGIALSRQRIGQLLKERRLAMRRPKLRVVSPDPQYWEKRGGLRD